MWNKPSNKKSKRAMKRAHKAHQFTSLPRATNTNQFNTNNWLGLDWSKQVALTDIAAPSKPGIYKISKNNTLLYCGESMNLKARIGSHKRNQLFSNASIACCAMPRAQSNHLKEREVDMIGAHYDAISECPLHQYSNARFISA